MKAILTRNSFEDTQTLGVLVVLDDYQNCVFNCKTLELAWKENQRRISCIPKGEYKVSKYVSPKFGEVYLLHNVPDRSMIEIHAGNYYTDILGCILVGESHTDINGDGFRDVTNSKKTLKKLLQLDIDSILVV